MSDVQSNLQGTHHSHRAILSVRVGTAAIDGTYVGSAVGWRWMVVGIVVIVVVVAVAMVVAAH